MDQHKLSPVGRMRSSVRRARRHAHLVRLHTASGHTQEVFSLISRQLNTARVLKFVGLRMRAHASFAIALIVSVSSIGRARVSSDIAADFSTRVWSYFELRSELEKGLPARTVTDDWAAIRRAERALAKKISAARAKARQGDIFTPAISVEFRNVLLLEMNASTWAGIMDDNPGEFSVHINRAYPEGKTVSTMPPNVLAALPRLPDDIEYRSLGRHLILLDTRAMVIVDLLPYAFRSRG
jgi:hypothetical protein